MKKWIFLFSLFAVTTMTWAKTPLQWLHTFYPLRVQTQPKCLGVEIADQGFYCMQADVAKPIQTADGPQLLVVMAGYKADAQTGKENGAHVNSGLVGVFVFQQNQGQWQLRAADPRILVGAFGHAPSGWAVREFGPGRWGVMNTHTDVHQGYAGSHYVILLPQGRGVQVNWIGASADNEGAIGDCRPNQMVDESMTVAQCRASSYQLDSSLDIDTTQPPRFGYYPLRVRIKGHQGLKTYRNQLFSVPYAATGYVVPKNYPLSDIDY